MSEIRQRQRQSGDEEEEVETHVDEEKEVTTEKVFRRLYYSVVAPLGLLAICCVFVGNFLPLWENSFPWHLTYFTPVVVVEGNCQSEFTRPFEIEFKLFKKEFSNAMFLYHETYPKMIKIYTKDGIQHEFDCYSVDVASSETTLEVNGAKKLSGSELEANMKDPEIEAILVLFRTHWDEHSDCVDIHLDRLASKLDHPRTVVARHYCDEEENEDGQLAVKLEKGFQNEYCQKHGIFGYPTTHLYVGGNSDEAAKLYEFNDGIFGRSRTEESLFAFWFAKVVLKPIIARHLMVAVA